VTKSCEFNSSAQKEFLNNFSKLNGRKLIYGQELNSIFNVQTEAVHVHYLTTVTNPCYVHPSDFQDDPTYWSQWQKNCQIEVKTHGSKVMTVDADFIQYQVRIVD